MKKWTIFLDIDGVLTYTPASMFLRTGHSPFMGKFDADSFDKNGVAILRKVISLTGADVVLASTWGFNATQVELDKLGQALGIKFSGVVKDDFGKGRSALINNHLALHPEIDNYFIIDDEDGSYLADDNYRVLVHTLHGFGMEHIDTINSIMGINLFDMAWAEARSNDESDEDEVWTPEVSIPKM